MTHLPLLAHSIMNQHPAGQFRNLLLNSLYETGHGLYSLSQMALLNMFLLNKFEMPIRANIFMYNRKLHQHYAWEITHHRLLPSHMVMGSGGSLVSGGIIMVHDYLKYQEQQKTVHIQEQARKMLPAPTQEQSLAFHKIDDYLPIAIHPFERDKAYYEPKNVLAMKGKADIEQNSELYDHVKNQIEYFLSLSLEERVAYMDRYTNLRTITQKECEKDGLSKVMIGQKGVFAPKKVKKYTLLGFYAGIYLPDKQTRQQVMFELGIKNCNNYLFGFGKDQEYPQVSAFGYGNRISVINSPTCYDKDLKQTAKEIALRNNVLALYIKTDAYPDVRVQDNPDAYDMIAYVTYQEVAQNGQFYIDYGMKYWTDKIENMLQTTQEDLAKAIAQFNIRQQKNNKIRLR